MPRSAVRPLSLAILISSAAAQEDPLPPWQFVDVAEGSGLDFRHSFGDDQFSKILEDTGSGVALIDYDGDGLLDVFLSSGHWVEGLSDPAFKDQTSSSRSRLYRNLGELKFRDVTDESGITEHGFGMGAIVGDYDADGDEDLYVLNWGPNVLYRNDVDAKGVRRFVDATAQAGLAGPETLNGERKWSVNGIFFDYDRDGDLDVYVANYLAFDWSFKDPNLPKEYPYEGPESYKGQQSMLYRNDGGGRFSDVTQVAGLANPDGKTMGVVACDLDGDGNLDLFEAMDSTKNLLWVNEGGWFAPGEDLAGVGLDRDGRAMASMHGSIGDINSDGLFDLFVPDLATGCLYVGECGGIRDDRKRFLAVELDRVPAARRIERGREFVAIGYSDESVQRGLAEVLKGSGAWGSTFEDFDLDGDLDLLVVLGGAFDLKAAEHDRLFLNDGRGRFKDVSEELGPSFLVKHVSRGAAFGDLDNDGDVDYVVNVKDVGAPPRLMRNDRPHARAGLPSVSADTPHSLPHWLTVKLVGAGMNRDAVGARVQLRAAGGTQWRQVNRANSYLSQCDSRLHFGLGGSPKVDGMMVIWPSGKEQVLSSADVGAVDRVIVVKEESKP